MNAADILKYGQLTVLQTIDGFPEDAWETSGACGDWSVKDIISHLTSFEYILEEVLAQAMSGPHSPTPYLTRYTDPDSGFNDTEVEKRKSKSVREVLDEFNDTHAQVMSMIGRISSEMLRQNGTLPWYGMEYALDDLFVYMYYGHKREHSAQIAAFRDYLKRLH
jgi:hypothetical protein